MASNLNPNLPACYQPGKRAILKMAAQNSFLGNKQYVCPGNLLGGLSGKKVPGGTGTFFPDTPQVLYWAYILPHMGNINCAAVSWVFSFAGLITNIGKFGFASYGGEEFAVW
jgi:hypothetical protein